MEYTYTDSIDFSAVFSDVEKDEDAFKTLTVFKPIPNERNYFVIIF